MNKGEVAEAREARETIDDHNLRPEELTLNTPEEETHRMAGDPEDKEDEDREEEEVSRTEEPETTQVKEVDKDLKEAPAEEVLDAAPTGQITVETDAVVQEIEVHNILYDDVGF
jgi:hypothetical protein